MASLLIRRYKLKISSAPHTQYTQYTVMKLDGIITERARMEIENTGPYQFWTLLGDRNAERSILEAGVVRDWVPTMSPGNSSFVHYTSLLLALFSRKSFSLSFWPCLKMLSLSTEPLSQIFLVTDRVILSS